jgi:hypothetical protein
MLMMQALLMHKAFSDRLILFIIGEEASPLQIPDNCIALPTRLLSIWSSLSMEHALSKILFTPITKQLLYYEADVAILRHDSKFSSQKKFKINFLPLGFLNRIYNICSQKAEI